MEKMTAITGLTKVDVQRETATTGSFGVIMVPGLMDIVVIVLVMLLLARDSNHWQFRCYNGSRLDGCCYDYCQ